MIATALALIDQINEQLEPRERELRSFARRQPGCLALQGQFGIGELTSVAILAELGDARRFSSSRHAVRFAGLDITVSQSDQRRAAGKLSHQGPPVLRWAVFEAAQCACRVRSPDHDYWVETRERLDGKQATLTIARKLARRCFHTLRELGPRRSSPSPNPAIASAKPTNSQMHTSLPASSLSFCDIRPRAAVHERPSGWNRSSRGDPSTITSPATTPSTQISPGVRGAIVPIGARQLHNHSPP